MSPRHFANLRKVDPASYKQGEDAVWNTFVTVTHAIGLSHFFSFTPDFYRDHKLDQAIGRFAQGEIPGDQDQTTQLLPPIE